MTKKRQSFGRRFRVRSSGLGSNNTETGAAVARNVAQIAKLEEGQIRARSMAGRVAQTVSRVAGTATCAITHVLWFAAWIVVNTGLVRRIRPFDPFPFNLLTMITSLEAIFLSIWILISQNDMTRQADRRTHLDLQVNLLAEQESTATLRLVEQMAQRMGIDVSHDGSLAMETDFERVALAVDDALPDSPGKSNSLPPSPLRT